MKRIKVFWISAAVVLIVGLSIALTMPFAYAQSSDQDESIWRRSRLTGNWGGLRSLLKDRGLTLDFEYTTFYQGLLSGDENKDFEFGGRIDVFVNLNTQKLGLWKGGVIKTHLESNHGDATPYRGGGLMAVNTGTYFPAGDEADSEITSIYLAQRITNHINLMIGKINGPDLLASSNFYGGWGIHRFMNMALATPPTGVPPAVRFGALATVSTKPIDWSVFIYDADDRTDDYWPKDLFENGVVSSLSAKLTKKWAGRTTSFTLAGLYSTKKGIDFSSVGLPPDLETTKEKGYYNCNLTFQHNLQENAERPGLAWGLHLKAAIADGNPNPFQKSILVGVGGNPLFLNRPADSFGLGVYYYRFSKELRSTVDQFIDFKNEYGMEFFYSYALTPWLHLTGDLQYVDPGRGGHDNATIAGLRINVRF